MYKTPMTRQQQAEITKDKLYYAAEALLNERDFNDITIRDIVAKAEVSIGTFYHYYTSKIDVFYDTFRLADNYFEDVVAPMLTQPTVQQRIVEFFNIYAHYSTDITSVHLTRLLYSPDNHFFNRDSQIGMLPVLRAQIQSGIDSGELCKDMPAAKIADYLMIAARGLVYNWCTNDGSYNLPDEMRSFITRQLRAYTA